MNISLPDELKSFVDDQIVCANYGTVSEYIRELIRRDQGRVKLHALLLDGAGSPFEGSFDHEYFDDLRTKLTVEQL